MKIFLYSEFFRMQVGQNKYALVIENKGMSIIYAVKRVNIQNIAKAIMRFCETNNVKSPLEKRIPLEHYVMFYNSKGAKTMVLKDIFRVELL